LFIIVDDEVVPTKMDFKLTQNQLLASFLFLCKEDPAVVLPKPFSATLFLWERGYMVP
jgi:hypothetical protein